MYEIVKYGRFRYSSLGFSQGRTHSLNTLQKSYWYMLKSCIALVGYTQEK